MQPISSIRCKCTLAVWTLDKVRLFMIWELHTLMQSSIMGEQGVAEINKLSDKSKIPSVVHIHYTPPVWLLLKTLKIPKWVAMRGSLGSCVGVTLPTLYWYELFRCYFRTMLRFIFGMYGLTPTFISLLFVGQEMIYLLKDLHCFFIIHKDYRMNMKS